MPFNFYHIERLEKHIDELRELRYEEIIPIKDFLATPEDGENVNQTPIKPTVESYTIELGDFWSGRDKYIWLSKEIEIPYEWKEKEVVGIFDFGKTGGGQKLVGTNIIDFHTILFCGEE